jgi:hypothetical protein
VPTPTALPRLKRRILNWDNAADETKKVFVIRSVTPDELKCLIHITGNEGVDSCVFDELDTQINSF